MKATELLDRYVYDVGRRLPAKQREDIEKELRSLLLDALDARAGGNEPTEEDVAAVLRGFGQPADVAMRYTGEKYLIGPRLYPTYRLVLGILLAVLAFGLMASFFVGLAFEHGPDIPGRLLQFLASLISGAWGAVGVVTVIFWGIERGIEKRKLSKDTPDQWDPKALQPIPRQKHAWKPADSIVAIIFTALAIVIFNGFPQVISIFWQVGGGQLQRIPIFSPDATAAYLPLWNAGWALGLILHTTLLIQGRWNIGTRLAHIGLQVFSVAVIGVMLGGPALFSTAFVQSGGPAWAEGLGTAMRIINQQFRWIFILAIIGCLADIGVTIHRIVTERK